MVSESPEDLYVYGHAPQGDTATCIIGATGMALHGPIDEEGDFSIAIPSDAVTLPNNGMPSFLINVTTADNQLLSAHAWGQMASMPQWVHERQVGSYERALRDLEGGGVPELEFTALRGGGVIPWPSDQRSIVKIWATWCGPCLTQVLELERLSTTALADSVSLLAISIDDEPEAALRFVEKNRIASLAVASDPEGQQIRQWLLDTIGTTAISVPLTIISSGNGQIQIARTGRMSTQLLISNLE